MINRFNKRFVISLSLILLIALSPVTHAESSADNAKSIFFSDRFDPSQLTNGAILQNEPLVMVRTVNSDKKDQTFVCEYVGKGMLRPSSNEQYGYWKVAQVDTKSGKLIQYSNSLIPTAIHELTPPNSAKGVDFGKRPPADMVWAIKNTDGSIIIKEKWNPAVRSDPYSGFVDVGDDSPYAVSIKSLKDHQIIDGNEDGTFGPYDDLTRAAFTKLLVTAFQLPKATNSIPFTDVKGQWSEPFILSAVQAGAIQGKTDTTFEPDAPLLREEAAAIVWRYVKSKGIDPTDKNISLYVPQLNEAGQLVYLPDNTSPWAIEAVRNVIFLHLFDYSLGTNEEGAYFFNSKDTIKRGEAAAFIHLSMKLLENKKQ